MTKLAYPTDVPVESVHSLIKVVTGNTPFVLADTALDVWNIQGYLQGIALGDGTAETQMTAIATAPLNDVETLLALQALLPGEEGVKAQGIFQGRGIITDILIQKLISSLMGWLNDWIEGGGIEDLLNKLRDMIGSSEAALAAAMSVPLAPVAEPESTDGENA